MALSADTMMSNGDDSQSLRRPFVGSVVFHAAIVGILVLASLQYQRNHETWGSPNPTAGGSVAISQVKSIPLPPRRGRVNPVASDTESVVPPAPAKPEPKRRMKAPDPDAIPLRSKTRPKPSPNDASNLRYRPTEPVKPNQVYSSQAPAAVNQMFAKAGAAGAVGLDANSVLGSRFGAYAALLMQRVADRWRTNGMEGLRAPMAIISVDIARNGTTRNPKLAQTSGNYQIDNSALRAVTEAAPFPPLPAEYERDMVTVEFRFQLQR